MDNLGENTTSQLQSSNDVEEPKKDPVKKVKRLRSKKAPGAPKRALSAYMIFGKEIRPGVVEEMPSASVTEVMKEIAKRWASLDEERKEEYNEKAKLDKQRYAEEVKNFDGPLKIPPKHKFKEPPKPKRGMTAFAIYSKENRENIAAENPELKAPDLMKEIGKRWKELDTEARAEYERKSEVDKERWKRENEIYMQQQSLTMNGKKGKDKDGPKRSMSAYMFFNKETRELVKKDLGDDARAPDILKEVAKRWSSLTDEDKIPFAEMARKDKERYEKERKAYKERQMSMPTPETRTEVNPQEVAPHGVGFEGVMPGFGSYIDPSHMQEQGRQEMFDPFGSVNPMVGLPGYFPLKFDQIPGGVGGPGMAGPGVVGAGFGDPNYHPEQDQQDLIGDLLAANQGENNMPQMSYEDFALLRNLQHRPGNGFLPGAQHPQNFY
eukprot:CAMPEP_0114994682 /NCGR_PEP_ID=MMETSP0216-20121206/13281_1 /TAXON_ID=223996 /ORGANISM="Protocruzia adherens, Strain Boccale" /LENGTH=436 /DNA_ID=CAMNT_0002358583 /DNA_START=105 /DNA_END=1415 /DNA_ORIENTATION=+